MKQLQYFCVYNNKLVDITTEDSNFINEETCIEIDMNEIKDFMITHHISKQHSFCPHYTDIDGVSIDTLTYANDSIKFYYFDGSVVNAEMLQNEKAIDVINTQYNEIVTIRKTLGKYATSNSTLLQDLHKLSDKNLFTI